MNEALSVRDEESSRLITVTEQLTMIVARLEARLSALEDRGGRTILHKDALALNRAIRDRAAKIVARYDLGEAGEKRIRSAIKKDVLRQYGIRDLHDLPEKMLPACRLLIDQWSSLAAIREVMGC